MRALAVAVAPLVVVNPLYYSAFVSNRVECIWHLMIFFCTHHYLEISLHVYPAGIVVYVEMLLLCIAINFTTNNTNNCTMVLCRSCIDMSTLFSC